MAPAHRPRRVQTLSLVSCGAMEGKCCTSHHRPSAHHNRFRNCRQRLCRRRLGLNTTLRHRCSGNRPPCLRRWSPLWVHLGVRRASATRRTTTPRPSTTTYNRFSKCRHRFACRVNDHTSTPLLPHRSYWPLLVLSLSLDALVAADCRTPPHHIRFVELSRGRAVTLV